MGNTNKIYFKMRVIIFTLALIAFANATLRCDGGYFKMNTRRTIQESLWDASAGSYDCISAGVPCAGHTAAEAERIIRSDWTANGGSSGKYFYQNAWCSPEVAGSAPWQGSTQPAVTWRFTQRTARRRLMKKH